MNADSISKKKVALLFAGCGHRDGAEITETVSLMISLSQNKAEVELFSPNLDFVPVNHLTGETQSNEKRNLLVEAARIARGKVKDWNLLLPGDFDALAISGGSGLAQHLSTWKNQGAHCEIHPQFEKIVRGFFSLSKPIAAVCIAPALVARVLGSHGITVTLGEDPSMAEEIKKTGAHHENCPVNDFITDRDHKILTSPAFMFAAQVSEVFQGLSLLSRELTEMA